MNSKQTQRTHHFSSSASGSMRSAISDLGSCFQDSSARCLYMDFMASCCKLLGSSIMEYISLQIFGFVPVTPPIMMTLLHKPVLPVWRYRWTPWVLVYFFQDVVGMSKIHVSFKRSLVPALSTIPQCNTSWLVVIAVSDGVWLIGGFCVQSYKNYNEMIQRNCCVTH